VGNADDRLEAGLGTKNHHRLAPSKSQDRGCGAHPRAQNSNPTTRDFGFCTRRSQRGEPPSYLAGGNLLRKSSVDRSAAGSKWRNDVSGYYLQERVFKDLLEGTGSVHSIRGSQAEGGRCLGGAGPVSHRRKTDSSESREKEGGGTGVAPFRTKEGLLGV